MKEPGMPRWARVFKAGETANTSSNVEMGLAWRESE